MLGHGWRDVRGGAWRLEYGDGSASIARASLAQQSTHLIDCLNAGQSRAACRFGWCFAGAARPPL
jgi:hypothetical protein